MKERMKSILFVLALALVFVGAMKVTEASAANKVKINYADEKIEIQATSGAVYYQVVTKTDLSKVKETYWIKAAMSGEEAWIDFSALANTKDCYVVYSESATAKGADLTDANLITIPAKVKSFKATFDFKTEEVASGGIYDIIAKLDVKGNDKQGADTFVWPAAEGSLKGKKLNEVVVLGWKRGANGNWKAASAFKTVDWEMMKASNSTLYLRVEKTDLNADKTFDEFRYSKEAKIKVPKAAKAPTIKVDYKKQTVAIKSGMEFRKVGDEKWIQVASKIKNSTGTDVFDVEKGLAKAVSALTLEQLASKSISVASGASVALEVRTAATDTKFASNIATVKFNAPAAAPTALDKANEKVLVYTPAVAATTGSAAVAAKLTLDLGKAVDKIDATYEYALVGTGYDLAKVKFTKVPATPVIDLSSKIKSDVDATIKYLNTSGAEATVKYREATVLIRKAVVTTKGSEAFASGVLAIAPATGK